MNSLKWVFFGTSDVSVYVLEQLKEAGIIPSLIITSPDKPQGRKFIITPTPVKVWAQKNNIKTLEPEILDSIFISELKKDAWDLFIVTAYGKIIPEAVLEIPKHKSINIHYSLLPKLRGSSPVEGAILNDDKDTGVSIILMDKKMDHGPIIGQKKVFAPEWPPTRTDLMQRMNEVASKMLIEVIPKWVEGKITPEEQDHEKATFVKMIKKEDALIDLKDDEYTNFRKIMAYERWPRAYFMLNGKRVIVSSASYKNGKLKIEKVIPEGKKEMDFDNFKKVYSY